MEDINLAKKRRQEVEYAGIEYYCLMSMYDIRNALTENIRSAKRDNNYGASNIVLPCPGS
jgi:hypothetical protein